MFPVGLEEWFYDRSPCAVEVTTTIIEGLKDTNCDYADRKKSAEMLWLISEALKEEE